MEITHVEGLPTVILVNISAEACTTILDGTQVNMLMIIQQQHVLEFVIQITIMLNTFEYSSPELY